MLQPMGQSAIIEHVNRSMAGQDQLSARPACTHDIERQQLTAPVPQRIPAPPARYRLHRCVSGQHVEAKLPYNLKFTVNPPDDVATPTGTLFSL